ncbi:histidine kinase N-terminal 7TM domain-containing protein [Halorubellus sp. PRR65]|uniref:histidine kinase N-terminal 7TM domain-containing protein n=1 Tax=Halorubellus sp. PRR65 TaxID=3098148 RepID=UPI002B2583A9|nr:histidine kinase N-terminal 7TM domain-containing protein [Halorubellus sp. PRR65]
MVDVTTTVGFAYLLTGTSLLVLLREPLQHPQKPGSVGFAVAIVGVALWPLALGANYFVAALDVSMALWNLRLLAAAVISVGWFHLAVSLTTGERLAARLRAPFLAYVLVGQAVAWTNPWHHLVLDPATTVDGTLLVPVDGPWFWVQAAVNYGLIVGSTMLLAGEWLRSTGVRRKQAGILAVAVVPPVAANLVTIFGVVDVTHDLTPFGLVGSGVLLSWALYRVGFLDVVPIARDIAMADMRDAVVTLDREDRVLDSNRAAKRLFDPPADHVGRPAEEFFRNVTPATRERFADVTDVDTELTTEVDGHARHFSMSISPVADGDTTLGRVLVLHDITEMKHRERELEERENQLNLLRKVLSRVLRHNIRNKLVTIRGNAADIHERSDDAFARERSEWIADAGDSLLAISEKARTVESIVDDADDAVRLDLADVAARAVDEYREDYPETTFAVDATAAPTVRAIPGLETAVGYLVENAAEHNDPPDPRVTVRVAATDDGPALAVVDNGPGIPDHELDVLGENEETALAHSDGIGLWVVKWSVDASNATLTFDVDDGGTTVTVAFDATAAGG